MTSPGVIGLGDESDDEVVWKRLGEAGVDRARELWSAAAEAAMCHMYVFSMNR